MEEQNKDEVVDTADKSKNEVLDDGTIRLNLAAEEEKETEDVEQPEAETTTEAAVENEEVPEGESEEAEEMVLEEISEEEKAEAAEAEELPEAESAEEESPGVEIPEGIQKLINFMDETGGSMEDFVLLNRDFGSLDEDVQLKEYYKKTKPHLTGEEIDFLMEDSFSFDEDIDDDKDIMRKTLAKKEAVAKAKNFLEGIKSEFYEEIKAGSRLNPEQKEAVDFFNRYNKEVEESTQVATKQKEAFLKETDTVFSNKFKGFEYNVGDKRFRFNVKNVADVKQTQSDINNFVKKFLNENNEMSDAKGYHKSLFTAMNSDAIANHFYEQGKSDGIKQSLASAKNISMDPNKTHGATTPSGFTAKVVSGDDSSKLRVKIRK